MKKSLEINSALFMFIALFFLSAMTLLFMLEFRFSRGIMTDYEESLRRAAVNKTNLFFNNLRAGAEGAARELSRRPEDRDAVLAKMFTFDSRITGAYILDSGGKILSGVPDRRLEITEKWFLLRRETSVLGVPGNGAGQMAVAVVTPLREEEWLALGYNITGFQQEILQEFPGDTCKVALFDQNNYPVIWPFSPEKLDQFTGREEKFHLDGMRYDVSAVKVGQPPWDLYFFLRENNFDTYRMITIMFLLFALYCCLYQFLVELWRVNSARSYFENIDFTIFDYLHEGVIISNNAGRIVFANQAAHEIFSERRAVLEGLPLKEILGYIENSGDEKSRYGTVTLKMSDRLLEAVHSPIVKKGKVLGALTVVGADGKEGKTCRSVLSKLIDALPLGVVHLDRNHKVVQANLMARWYLGSLETGMSIDEVDPELAGFIYRSMGSGSLKPVQLTSRDLPGEVVGVYTEDGTYAGALVLINGAPQNKQA
ncbi:MAG: PAS domain-containing protein [Bacillota bacterium]